MSLPPAVAACNAAVTSVMKPDLMAAEQQLSALLNEAPTQSIVDLIAASVRSDAPENVAQMCAIRAKNFIKNDMTEAHDVDLLQVKHALVAAVPVASDRIRRMLCECARVVHSEEPWDDLLPLLVAQISQVGSEQPTEDAQRRALSALHLLYVIVRPFKSIGLVAQDEQHDVCNTVLPLLPPLFAFPDLRIAHMGLKCFEAMVQQATPPVLKGDLFDRWMSFMLEFAGSRRPDFDLSMNSPYTVYVKCMKRIAAVSYRFVQLAARRGKQQPKVARHFVANFAGHFVNLWCEWLRFLAGQDESVRQSHAKATVNALRFIRECAAIESVYPALPVAELCTALLFPYFPFNAEDEELWSNDVNEYLRRLADPNGSKTDLRHAATKALLTLVSAKKPFQSKEHLGPVLTFVHEGLQKPATQETDGFLHILGMLKRLISRVPVFAAAMEGVLVNNIAPLMSAQSSVLRAKAVWICGLYASVPFSDPTQFESMLRAVLGGLEDAEAPVRMQVVASLASFVSLRRSHPYLRDVLSPLARECIRLIDDNNSDFAVEALRALLEVFGPELSAHMSSICKSLMQRCRAARFDMQAAMSAGGVDNWDEDGEAATLGERGAFAARSSLEAIVSCVEAVGYDDDAMAVLEADLCALVAEVFGDDDLDLTEIALKIFDRVVYFRKDSLCEAGWAVLPMLHRTLVEGAVDLFPQFLPILDNMATNHPGVFATPERLQMTHEMVAKMLDPEVLADPSAVVAAPEVISVLFLQLRDHRAAFDPAAAEFLSLTLQALSVCDAAPVRAGLCTALLSAFIYSAEATCQALDATGATAAVLSAYADFMQKPGNIERRFPTALGRKVHLLGICSYLQHSLKTGRSEAAALAERLAAIGAKCMQYNVPVYHRSVHQLQALLSGTGGKDGTADDGYESDDSMDVEEGEEDDGGYGEELDLDEDEPPARGSADEDDEEDFDIETTIDPICEAACLAETLAQCPQNVQAAVTAAWPGAIAELPAAQKVSGEVIALTQQLREAAKAKHQSRASVHLGA